MQIHISPEESYAVIYITVNVDDVETEAESKIYFELNRQEVEVDRFESISPGLTAHLNGLLIEDDDFKSEIEASIRTEIDLFHIDPP